MINSTQNDNVTQNDKFGSKNLLKWKKPKTIYLIIIQFTFFANWDSLIQDSFILTINNNIRFLLRLNALLYYVLEGHFMAQALFTKSPTHFTNTVRLENSGHWWIMYIFTQRMFNCCVSDGLLGWDCLMHNNNSH